MQHGDLPRILRVDGEAYALAEKAAVEVVLDQVHVVAEVQVVRGELRGEALPKGVEVEEGEARP